MSYRSVNPNQKEFVKPRRWKDWKPNEYVIGTKVECKEKDKFKKPIYAIKVRESNFDAPVGELLYLNCGGNFQNLIEMVEDGEECKIIYKGMAKIKKGEWSGEKTHDIDVQMAAGAEASESEDDSDSIL